MCSPLILVLGTRAITACPAGSRAAKCARITNAQLLRLGSVARPACTSMIDHVVVFQIASEHDVANSGVMSTIFVNSRLHVSLNLKFRMLRLRSGTRARHTFTWRPPTRRSSGGAASRARARPRRRRAPPSPRPHWCRARMLGSWWRAMARRRGNACPTPRTSGTPRCGARAQPVCCKWRAQ